MYRIKYQCDVEHETLRKSKCFLCGSTAAGEKKGKFIYFDCPDCGAYFVINGFRKLVQERPVQFKKFKKEIQSKILAKHEFMGKVPVILPFQTKDFLKKKINTFLVLITKYQMQIQRNCK